MTDPRGGPRRVSMAYILGFSNKPFKDGSPSAPPPAPRHPNAFKQMASVTTPGGVIEWAASDGRRGKLTGPGKPRLTAANLAAVPEAKVSVKAASEKDAAEDDGDIVAACIGDDAPAAQASAKAADDDKNTDSDWTKEQDEKLLKLRAANHKGPWNDIASELGDGKEGWQCNERFNKIKPKDWRPNNVNGGGGGKQKQGKQKEQKRQKNQKDGEKKDEETEDGAADGGFGANAGPGGDGNDGWGNTNDTGGGGGNDNTWGNNSGGKDDGWGATDNSSGDNKADEGFNNDSNGWGVNSGDKGATGDWQNNTGGGNDGWNNSNDTSGNTGAAQGGDDSWGKPANDAFKDNISKKTSSNKGSSSNKNAKEPSNRAPSQSGSKHHSSRSSEKPSASARKGYELRPDSTFSANDLRLIAKILQQDCSMVWNRVSWRFKDKTGRNLHPDVFEKKIMGRIEDRGSERGGR